MGNCSHKGVSGECTNTIRILTDSGVILQFKGPKLVKDVLVDYSGHGIFRQLGDLHASKSLSDYEYLVAGQSYYLLPLRDEVSSKNQGLESTDVNDHQQSLPYKPSSGELSESSMENLAIGPAFEVLPTLKNGVWRVKLVINTKQLGEILSEEENMEALIEKMRVAATATNPSRPSRSSWGSTWKIRPALSNAFKVSSAESC